MIINDPLPTDRTGSQLCKIFSYAWKTIEADAPAAGSPAWRTIKNYPLRPRSLWQKYCDPETLVGVRFDKTTRYGVIDLDVGGRYCNEASYIRICEALETIGIVRTIPIRSSHSGGIHVYIPLPSDVSTFDLATTLKYALESQGFSLQPGHCEIFPNVKAYANWHAGIFSEYNAHRLPLQPGSGSLMLNQQLQPIQGNLQSFFYMWEFAANAQALELLKPALAAGRNKHRKRRKTKHHPIASWLADLQTTINEGFSSHGQTNNLLKDIGCLGRVFLRLAGDELADYIHSTVIALPGFARWCRHQHEIQQKARLWALAAEGFYWPMGAKPKRDLAALPHNRAKTADAQKRIKRAMGILVAGGDMASGVAARAAQLAQLAKTSLATLYRNKDLWYPGIWSVSTDLQAVEPPTPPLPPNCTPPPKSPDSKGLQVKRELLKGVQLEISQENLFSSKERGGEGGERKD